MTDDARHEIDAAPDLRALQALRVHYLGKKGVLTEQLKGLGALAPDERRRVGAALHEAKRALEEALDARKSALERADLDARLAAERLDLSLPGSERPPARTTC
jgi:phenylalanyl-tRNA synthetase alpha chain